MLPQIFPRVGIDGTVIPLGILDELTNLTVGDPQRSFCAALKRSA